MDRRFILTVAVAALWITGAEALANNAGGSASGYSARSYQGQQSSSLTTSGATSASSGSSSREWTSDIAPGYRIDVGRAELPRAVTPQTSTAVHRQLRMRLASQRRLQHQPELDIEHPVVRRVRVPRSVPRPRSALADIGQHFGILVAAQAKTRSKERQAQVQGTAGHRMAPLANVDLSMAMNAREIIDHFMRQLDMQMLSGGGRTPQLSVRDLQYDHGAGRIFVNWRSVRWSRPGGAAEQPLAVASRLRRDLESLVYSKR